MRLHITVYLAVLHKVPRFTMLHVVLCMNGITFLARHDPRHVDVLALPLICSKFVTVVSRARVLRKGPR